MTGCIALRKDVYYVRLSYYDKTHKRKDKWISTGLSGRGAKQKATAMIQSLIEKYSYLEKSDHPSKMADYLLMWKNLRKGEVAETTFDGYHTYIDRHLVPYFKDLNLDIQDITAVHIFDYVTPDKFEDFLEAFDSNPFKVNDDKNFRKQFIENIIKYSHDHMSLITAALLIKKKFTIEEIIHNYYSNVNVFEDGWF